MAILTDFHTKKCCRKAKSGPTHGLDGVHTLFSKMYNGGDIQIAALL